MKNKKGYFRNDWIFPLIVGLVIVVIFLKFNLLDIRSSFLDEDRDYYDEVREFVNTCEKEHNDLLNVSSELERINSIDIQRAYKECREDIKSVKDKHFVLGYLFIMLGMAGTFLSWYLTKNYYEKRIKGKKK